MPQQKSLRPWSGPDHRGWRSVSLRLQLLPAGDDDVDDDLWTVPMKVSFELPAPGYPLEKMMPCRVETLQEGETAEGDRLGSLKAQMVGIVQNALATMRVEEYLASAVFVPGSSSVFDVVEWIRSDLVGYLSIRQEVQALWRQWSIEEGAEEKEEECQDDHVVTVYRSEAMTDRKSKFVAHLAPVSCRADVDAMLRQVLQDRKVAAATHNILAYRFRNPDGTLDAHRDDDGEGGAGDKLLNLLQQCDVEGVAIIVTRWYGGIHLGPDRFKRINERAKEVLRQQGYLK